MSKHDGQSEKKMFDGDSLTSRKIFQKYSNPNPGHTGFFYTGTLFVIFDMKTLYRKRHYRSCGISLSKKCIDLPMEMQRSCFVSFNLGNNIG